MTGEADIVAELHAANKSKAPKPSNYSSWKERYSGNRNGSDGITFVIS